VLLVTGFVRNFLRIFWHFRSIFLALVALIVIGAVAIAYVENLSLGVALYFACVTGLTIGYGDIVMKTTLGRCVALLIAFIGLMFTGLVIAAAVEVVRKIYHQEG
jgi:voltage-gated potassium channel